MYNFLTKGPLGTVFDLIVKLLSRDTFSRAYLNHWPLLILSVNSEIDLSCHSSQKINFNALSSQESFVLASFLVGLGVEVSASRARLNP